MKKLLLIILIGLAFTPKLSLAQEKYTLLEPLPCIEGTNNGDCTNGVIPEINLNTYINYVFKFAIALAGFLAIVMIIWGGFEWMLSEVPNSKLDGKKKIKNAIWGLAGVLASYLILATIDPRLVQINTRIEPVIVDTSDVEKFQVDLEENVNLVDYTNQRSVEIGKSEIERLNNLLDILDKNDPDYSSTILRINEIESNIIKTETTNNSIKNFVTTLNNKELLKTLDNYDKRVELFPIDEVILELKEKQDFEGIATLEKNNRFFITEIDNQRSINNKIDSYDGSSTKRKSLEESLDRARDSYNYMIGESEQQENAYLDAVKEEIVREVYIEILKDRINRITESIKN